MQGHAHLRLIVSEPPSLVDAEPAQDRISLVQPVSRARRSWQWLKRHGALVTTALTAGLLVLAALSVFARR